MNVEFFDREDGRNPLNGSIIGERAHLFEVLNQLQGRAPFFCEIGRSVIRIWAMYWCWFGTSVQTVPSVRQTLDTCPPQRHGICDRSHRAHAGADDAISRPSAAPKVRSRTPCMRADPCCEDPSDSRLAAWPAWTLDTGRVARRSPSPRGDGLATARSVFGDDRGGIETVVEADAENVVGDVRTVAGGQEASARTYHRRDE
jgi:hypothetical protein